MKPKILIALLFVCNACFAQPTLSSYGEPFVRSNVINLGVIETRNTTSGSCDTIAVLIDKGEISGYNTQNFEVLFVTLGGVCENVHVKDYTGVTDVSVNLGEPTIWKHGLDGKLYVGTNGDGGHIVRIDIKNKTAIDLGKPYSSSGSGGYISALAMGADLALCGVVSDNGQNYAFRYTYGCSFNLLAYSSGSSSYNLNLYVAANYPTFTNVADVTTDSVYTYVQASNADNSNYVLFAITNATNKVSAVDLLSGIGGGYLHGGYFYIDTYAEDRVLIRDASGIYEVAPTSGTPTLTSASATAGKRLSKDIWKSKAFNAASEYGTTYNNDDFKFHFTNSTDSGDINLYSCIRKVGKPISALAPYINGTTGDTSLFIHGDAARQGFSYNLNNNTLTKLGANTNAATSAITNAQDYSQVYIGGHNGAGGRIQMYSSGSPWLYGTNPADVYNVATPYPAPNTVGWFNNMKMIKNPAYIIAWGTNAANRIGATIDETALAIVNPNNGNINSIYHPLFSQYHYGAMDVDQKNKYIVMASNRDNPTTGIYYTNTLMVFDTAGQLKFNYILRGPNGDTMANLATVSVDTSNNLYYSEGGALYVINDYVTKGLNDSTSVVGQLVYTGPGAIRAQALLPDLKYIAVGVGNNGTDKYEVHIVDVTDRGRSYPSNLGNTVIVQNSISPSDGKPVEFAFVGKYGFLAGFNNLWGFDYSSVTTPVLDFDNYDVQRNAPGGIKASMAASEIQTIKAFPNPAKQLINITLTSANNQSSNIQIYDARGTLVSTKKVTLVSGKNTIEVNIQHLASGMYLLKLANASGVLTKRFIKQ